MMMEHQGKVLVVTSPTLQEGKTTTIVNLALTMAQNGQRTLLIGGNLRHPSIHRFFGIDREPGLSDVLVGNAAWRDCIRTVADILMGRFEMEDIMASPGLDNLHIIESGSIPANPLELLSTPAMSQFLREVRGEYDVVLIDTPPVLPITDSSIVGARVDGVILVDQAGKVDRLVLKRAKTQLEAARGRLGLATRAPAPPPPVTSVPGASPEAGAGRSPRRTRFLLGGVLALAVPGVLAGVVGWQKGWLAPDVRPRELRHQRLEPSPMSPLASALPWQVAASVGSDEPVGAVAALRPPAAVEAGAPPAGSPVAPAAVPRAKPTTGPVERFAVEFGPFATAGEAERVERQLNEAGHQTVRFRQQTGATLYAVVVERVPSTRQAQAIVATLHEQGFPETMVLGEGPTLTVRVGDPLVLRGAVQLAERLRDRGHLVRVAVQPGEAESFVIRHGNFASQQEADERAEELGRLGLPNHVVRAR